MRAPLAWLAAILLLGDGTAHAQTRDFSVSVLKRAPLTGDAAREAVVATAEFAPGASTGWHTHPGDEYATVLEGVLEVRARDRAPLRVEAGQAYHNARGVIHETRNVGSARARVLSTFVVDRGQPLVQPVK